jgi:hypothetical protein
MSVSPEPPADALTVIGSADIFCADRAYLHLEQDWRRGLGWWLVDGAQRRHLTVAEAMRTAPEALAEEVLREAQFLIPSLQLDRVLRKVKRSGFQAALEGLRADVAVARNSAWRPVFVQTPDGASGEIDKHRSRVHGGSPWRLSKVGSATSGGDLAPPDWSS